jgi:hypothetical protein
MENMKEIKDLTQENLYHIANLATGGYFNSDVSREHKEVEVGGYGKRKRVEWIQNAEGYDEDHYFEISSENSDGWAWHCQTKVISGGATRWHTVNTIAPHRIVDWLRNNEFNIKNK